MTPLQPTAFVPEDFEFPGEPVEPSFVNRAVSAKRHQRPQGRDRWFFLGEADKSGAGFFGKRRQPDLHGDAHINVGPEIENDNAKTS